MTSFPKDFIWGTSTAAYQIEGAALQYGRGPCIWDTFSHIPGKIKNNENGDVACDHYHRLEEDLDLVAGLVKNYRFSISWSRVLPEGTGAVNPEGIAFYNRLIDGLISRGVTPWVTMFHWDLPQALQDKGGWANREILLWFKEYAQLLSDSFGDRVNNWMVLNEPSVHSWLGHGLGFHAPGLADEKSYLTCVHHQNLVIGQTFRQFKAIKTSYNVGSAYTMVPALNEVGKSDPEAVEIFDAFWNRNFFDPLMLGKYPDKFAGPMAQYIQAGDMELCKTALDFVGVQHYNAIEAKRDETRIFNTFFGDRDTSLPMTDYGWSINPDGFYDGFMDFTKRYGTSVPLIVTENGAAFFDKAENGKSHDPRRISFLEQYIAAMARAMDDGARIEGYFVWSFLDNFEWADGYDYRFGLVHVDYQNEQKRTPKDSYFWYRDLIKAYS